VVDKDYNTKGTLKILDIIINEKNYTKIELNELESNKSSKLKSINEATQSQRLSTISDKLKEKCKILTVLKNKFQAKSFHILKELHLQEYQTISNSLSTQPENTNPSDTNNKHNDTLINVIDNINKITQEKKTIISIIDSFENSDDNKLLLSTLCGTIANTKCPIIIFSSKITFLKLKIV